MYENDQIEEDYFSRLDLSLFTLFQLMTLDGWTDIVRTTMVTYSWSWIPLVIYILLTGIVVTNIVIAIICDSILSMHNEDNEEKDIHARLTSCAEEMNDFQQEIRKRLHLDDFGIELKQSSTSGLQMVETHSFGNSYDGLIASKENKKPAGFRQRCGDFVNNSYFQVFIMFLIISNAILMAIGTFDFVVDNPAVQSAFDLTDMVYLCIYSFESMLQIIYHGVYIYKDGWATFDLILVLASWILSSTAIPLQAARSLRIIRILRLVPKLKSLKLIISAVIRVMPKLGGIAGILGLIFYIFAIIFTVAFQDYELSDNFFGTLDATLFTLFQIMTMSDWAMISRELMEYNVWAPLLIIVFLIISGFIFLNLIIALICEAMGAVEEMNDELNQDQVTNISTLQETSSEETLTTLDRLEYIEKTQKNLRELLQTCTIIVNREDPQSLVLNSPGGGSIRSDSEGNLDIFLDASED